MFKIDTTISDYMSIILTHECNKKCPFCIDQYRGRKEYIEIEDVHKALKFAKTNGIRDILIVGGEPTLHPDIKEICRIIKTYGFNLILTTNYTNIELVQELDLYVDSFNISWYHQKVLPQQRDFKADITLSALIFQGQLDSKDKLDCFIDEHQDLALKFSTLSICNDWTRQHQDVSYLDSLPGERVVLFNEIEGVIYRGYVIKRYDRIINSIADQSFKCHVDGDITRSWNRC